MSRVRRIGPTAHYTGYVWQRLGMPHAELFSTKTGAVLYLGFFALGEWRRSGLEEEQSDHTHMQRNRDQKAGAVLFVQGACLSHRSAFAMAG